ncbi:efflux transporter outer membrane subunit [Chitinophaga sp. GCM10012297]|uniref:Efflux transporter outer membrane subunit n=1 Tax=Chitinophaga chungangae TaxID=2821488 RepID=A0ABS3Y9I4_9BACT|nr:efflux transporter outer membrane subunit [Chitinophaga chungangae]MBO9151301.1 efflux transporter outer membrane subunit [Chitinophaga chungangae]
MNNICKGLLVLTMTGLGACSMPGKLTLPEARPVPVAGNDTLSLSAFQQVFRDPHLRALIDTAMLRNNDLLAAAQRIEAARANLLSAKNAALPSLDLSVSAGVEKYGDYTMNGVGNFDTNLSPNIDKDQRIPRNVPDYFVGLRSSWEIDLWGKLKSRKKAAYHRLLASQEGQRLLKTQIAAGIAGMYYELTALDEELRIIERNILLQETAVATVNVQKAAGRATELAVQQFTAQLLSTQGLAYNIRQEINAIENQLNAALGRFPMPIARRVDTSLPVAVTGNIPVSLLLRRPDVRQAELELAASRADVEAARASFLPSLTLTPYAGFNSFKAGLLFQTPASIAWGIAGGITAPIFNKRQLKSQFNISTASATSAFYHWQQAVVDGYKEIATALNKVENQQRVYALKNKEVAVLTGAVATANTMYTTGYASYLEVITAQKSVLEAELALVSTRRHVNVGLVELYRALGGGVLQ